MRDEAAARSGHGTWEALLGRTKIPGNDRAMVALAPAPVPLHDQSGSDSFFTSTVVPCSSKSTG
jgi:hypothetical protein